MSNQHIDQENVLGSRAETHLSQSEIPERDDSAEERAPQSGAGSRLPALAGIAIAIAVVGFFGLKVASSMLGGADQIGDADPLPAAPPAFEQPPQVPPGADLPRPPFVEPTAEPSQAGAPSMPPPADGVTQNSHVTPNATAAPPGAPSANTTTPSMPTVSLDVPAEIGRVNKRLDEIAAALAALTETVGKLQSTRAAKSEHEKPGVKAERLADRSTGAASGSPTERKRRASPAVEPAGATTQEAAEAGPVSPPKRVAKKPAEAPQKGDLAPAAAVASSTGESRAATGDVALQAVLQDRAWFRLKGGETATAGVGEEVPGVGVVRAIDVEAGRVTFANGTVLR